MSVDGFWQDLVDRCLEPGMVSIGAPGELAQPPAIREQSPNATVPHRAPPA
jgi:hypothetical protein